MNTTAKAKWLGVASLCAPLLGLGGCTEYTIDTTLNPDGSGVRRESMEVGKNDELTMEPSRFLELMHAGEDQGWSHGVEVEEGGDTVHVFRRETAVGSLAAWSGQSGRVRIDAAPLSRSRARVGYVALGEVRFRNTVRVSTARVSDGSTSYTYRETFTWENGTDVLVEALLQNFQRRLEGAYPRLTPQERGEVVGFARARLWAAVEEGLFTEDSDDDGLVAQAAEETLRQGAKVIRVRYPNVPETSLREVFSLDSFGTDEDLTTLLEETVPGMNLALNSEIRFLLRMPGRVTRSNAQEREGETLIWEFGPLEALAGPVEIVAESVGGS